MGSLSSISMRESAAEANEALRPKRTEAPSRAAPFKSARLRIVVFFSPWSASGGCACGHIHNSLRPRSHYVECGTVVINLLQDRLYRLQFDELPAPSLFFHLF